MKYYMVKDLISDNCYSIVAGFVRAEEADRAYVYDKKHANIIADKVNKMMAYFFKSPDAPKELKTPVDLKVIPVSWFRIPLVDKTVIETGKYKLRHGHPFDKTMKECKLEQLRRFNDYIDYDYETLDSHKYRYITETF